MADHRFDAGALRDFCRDCFIGAGVAPDKAAAIGEILVEGDLLGHTTHGLQMMIPYMKSVAKGGMLLDGEPEILRDRAAAFAWDGRYLAGPWLVMKAIDEAVKRAQTYGLAAATIVRSHHIACLQAYLKRVTDQGMAIMLTCSDPAEMLVAPHGGKEARYTPNPLAFGAPTEDGAILIDVTLSTVTNGMAMRLNREGKKFPALWLKDADGNPTDDPGARFTDPMGSFMPLGGVELGHKGFALGTMVEVLTSALSGHGRGERPTRWNAAVFLQVFDPEFFGGREAFIRENSYFSDLCRATPVVDGNPPVRMPGDGSLARRAEQLKNGVRLYDGIEAGIRKCGEDLGVAFPAPL